VNSSEVSSRQPCHVELGCVGYGHDRHDAGLNRVGDDEIGGLRDAAGHVQADHQQALRSDFADGALDLAAHQGTGQHQGAGARQAGFGAHSVRNDGPGRDDACRAAPLSVRRGCRMNGRGVMAGILYNWKRFWCPRGGRINLWDRGFLADPDGEWGSALNPDVVPFQAVAQFPCLILLGEPGIGKSTALRGECDRAQEGAAKSGRETHWVDLQAYQTDSRLHQDVFESSALCSWRQGTHHLDLFLDSLDECRMRIDNVSAVLTSELERLPIERLSLRIACRTAEWPSGLESALRRLWGNDAVKAFELAPLRRVDVAEAARTTGVDPNAFLSELGRREAVPLAIKPVTLEFLLNTYRRRQGFPASQAQLYAEGCRCLCEETSESRRDARLLGDLTADQRLAIAARIAAITILCNHYAIWTGTDRGDVPSEDIRLEDLIGGAEGKNDAAVEVSRAAIRETLDTGLFSSRGLDRIGWAHQTYAEFLAARFLVEHGLPPNRIMTLIVHPDGKIVPQLRETAAWLANMKPEVFREGPRGTRRTASPVL
jgi:predicted NACHT family NTPase